MDTSTYTGVQQSGQQPIPIWVFVFLAIFFAVFIISGIVMIKSYKHKQEVCTVKVEAVVIENKKVTHRSKTKNGHRRTTTTYAPVYSYTYNGTDYTQKSSVSANPPVFNVGDRVELYLNPSNPQEIFVPRDKTLYYLGLGFSVGGFVIGVLVMIALIKQSK